MTRILQIALLLPVLAGCKEGTTAPSAAESTYVNRTWAFSLRIPSGWTLQDTSYSWHHYTDVFLLARNARARGITPQDVVQLPEGAIVVMFSQNGFARNCLYRVDTVEDSVATLLKGVEWKTFRAHVEGQPQQALVSYEVGFDKWDESWDIWAVARNPKQADRQAAERLLRSLVFQQVPVTLPGQALRFAYNALPSEARNLRRKAFTLLCPEVVQDGEAYLVTFSSVDEQALAGRGNSGAPPSNWSYTVSVDGTVASR
jgi:hypothetical protein